MVAAVLLTKIGRHASARTSVKDIINIVPSQPCPTIGFAEPVFCLAAEIEFIVVGSGRGRQFPSLRGVSQSKRNNRRFEIINIRGTFSVYFIRGTGNQMGKFPAKLQKRWLFGLSKREGIGKFGEKDGFITVVYVKSPKAILQGFVTCTDPTDIGSFVEVKECAAEREVLIEHIVESRAK